MPYDSRTGGYERARSTGHVPIVQNELVKERLGSYRISMPQEDFEVPGTLIVSADSLPVPGEPARWVMSFDGSPHEVAVREEYPSTRIGYLQIGGVLVHLDELLGQQNSHLVDPSIIHRASHESLYSMVLPGSNVCRSDMNNVADSWRAEIFEIFRDYRIEDVSLLDVFMALILQSDKRSPTGGVVVARCPVSDCGQRDIDVPDTGTTCPNCGAQVFPTDALRIHEEVSEEHANATALGRFMMVLEHLTMLAYLSYLSQRLPRALANVAFIIDGPLALFGPQAWMHTTALSFYHGICNELMSQSMKCPIVVGVEKGGLFAEHATAIEDRIPSRHLLYPSAYIMQHEG